MFRWVYDVVYVCTFFDFFLTKLLSLGNKNKRNEQSSEVVFLWRNYVCNSYDTQTSMFTIFFKVKDLKVTLVRSWNNRKLRCFRKLKFANPKHIWKIIRPHPRSLVYITALDHQVRGQKCSGQQRLRVWISLYVIKISNLLENGEGKYELYLSIIIL